MFFAARKLDTLTHDMLVPSGIIGPPISGPCPAGGPVLIEGLPAAHANCTAVCTGAISAGLVHPPPPGPPPPVAMGSPTVYVHGMPLSRWVPSGDTGGCGCFLGDPKLMATRRTLVGSFGMGSPGAPGAGGMLGAILGGLLLKLGLASPYPRAVLQPDGSIVTEYNENVRITGTPEFQAQVVNDLDTIAGTPTGERLFDSLADADGNVTIQRAAEGEGNACGYDSPDDRFANPDGTPGAGSDSTVYYDPDRTSIGDGSEDWMDRPPAVGLGHELVHAERAANGTQPQGSTDGTRNRELQAVGLDPYGDSDINENSLRDDLDEPERTYY